MAVMVAVVAMMGLVLMVLVVTMVMAIVTVMTVVMVSMLCSWVRVREVGVARSSDTATHCRDAPVPSVSWRVPCHLQ
eukprot:532004-Alexandrium_andersonii.AAC.1